jgi:hypothetical protein
MFDEVENGGATLGGHSANGREVLKATVVIILSIALGSGAVMAIPSKSKSVAVRAAIAGTAVVLFAIVLKREKE